MDRRVLLSALSLALAGVRPTWDPMVISNHHEPNPVRAIKSLSPTRGLRAAKSAGISMAQQKRAAKKRKNRARHKLAMKRR